MTTAPGTSARVPTRSNASKAIRRSRAVWLILVLALLEAAWLGWFVFEPLPNAPGQKGPIRRGLLLLTAIPGVIPGTSFRESLLGEGLDEMSHWENLPQRLPIVAAAGLIAMAAIGLGELVITGLKLREGLGTGERIAIAFGVGTAGLGVLTMLLGRLGLLAPWPFRAGLATIAAAGLFGFRPWSDRGFRTRLSLLPPFLIVAPFLAIMLLGSMLPAIDFDVLEYHLQGPKEYFQAGRIEFLPHNVYTNMPFNVEMLHLIGMEVMGDWWWGGLVGQFLVALYAPLAAILIAATASRIGSPRAGGLAAIVYLTTPWIYRLAVIAYVEGPLCFFHAALVWGIVRGWNDDRVPRARLWCLMGLLAGGAMGCKYPGLISAVIPFGLLSIIDSRRHHSFRPVLAYVLGWSIIMVPWLAKNVVDTHNPVYPLAYRLIGGAPWDAARELQWSNAHGPREITLPALVNSVVDIAGRSDWQSPLFLAFCPLSFARPGTRKSVLTLAGYGLYLFATWWLFTHRLDRFCLPLLPCLAVLAGLGADWSEALSWRLVRGTILTFAVAMNLVYCSTALAGLNEWTGDLRALRRDLPFRLNAPLSAMDTQLPPGARILLVGQAAVFHVDHPILYNTVFNPETIEDLSKGLSPLQFKQVLRDRGLTHIYVDWKEIGRHRQPGGYGFTDYVTIERFGGWVKGGVLRPPVRMGLDQVLYEIN